MEIQAVWKLQADRNPSIPTVLTDLTFQEYNSVFPFHAVLDTLP